MNGDLDVLIVGGGPVGLTLAIELGQVGVRSMLIDKRPELGRLPKMERCNARTMENFRRAGLADQIRAVGFPSRVPMDVFICLENVVRPPLVHHEYPSVDELKRTGLKVNDGTMPLEPYQLVSQYTLEPLLRDTAAASEITTVQFGSELVDLHQTDEGVVATVADLAGGTREIRARYLVGCDGGASRVRDILGFTLEGESLLEMRQALFYCEDLFERIPIGPGRHYHVADDTSTFLIVQDDLKHFSLHATGVTDEEMPALFERVAGMPIEYETLYIGKWTQRLMVADRYAEGNVFLAGDSAHLVIPTGGLGMNTGAGDAIDLAWKLAGTIQGWGGPGLLASYETERRAIGLRNVAASRKAATGRRAWRAEWSPEILDDTPAGEAVRTKLAETADREQRWSNDLYGIELGYRYESPLIVADDAGAPDPNSFTYTPTTTPGARLPHVWLDDDTALQDRLGRTYTLVMNGPEDEYAAELGRAFEGMGVPFASFSMELRDDATIYHHEKYLLVRPDLHIAWRGTTPHPDPDALARQVSGW